MHSVLLYSFQEEAIQHLELSELGKGAAAYTQKLEFA